MLVGMGDLPSVVHTSSGFLLMKMALIFVKCEAMRALLRSSSGRMSSKVSQKGTRSWSDSAIHVSTMDHMSLQRTSVATWGYLGRDDQQCKYSLRGPASEHAMNEKWPHCSMGSTKNMLGDEGRTHLNRPIPSPSISPEAYPKSRRRTSVRWK